MTEEQTRQEASAQQSGQVTSDVVLDALSVVVDPEIGIDIVNLGLVYDVTVTDGEVNVVYTLTSMGCPVGPMIEAQMQQIVETLPGVTSVKANLVFRPAWSPEMMSDDAKAALGYL